MAPATELLDKLIEEIFLRIDPADAATLARAALVCRRWCRVIADPGFRRWLREFHRAPPMLGFFCNIDDRDHSYGYSKPPGVARFLRTSSGLKRVDMKHSFVVDTRHGRVLLLRATDDPCDTTGYLQVWDPITKERHTLPWLRMPQSPKTWNAAVLYTATGCDHLDCHGKPFAVVLVSTNYIQYIGIFSLVYSSEAHRWSEEETHLSAQQREDPMKLEHSPGALVGNALYFVLQGKTKILKYTVSTREMHTIHLPPACSSKQRILLMPTEDGRLGFATVHDSKLFLWSRDGDSDKDDDVGWTPRRVINLEALLPIGALESPADVVGS
ncbi:unnamed protein product [Urochloa humidicola]